MPPLLAACFDVVSGHKYRSLVENFNRLQAQMAGLKNEYTLATNRMLALEQEVLIAREKLTTMDQHLLAMRYAKEKAEGDYEEVQSKLMTLESKSKMFDNAECDRGLETELMNKLEKENKRLRCDLLRRVKCRKIRKVRLPFTRNCSKIKKARRPFTLECQSRKPKRGRTMVTKSCLPDCGSCAEYPRRVVAKISDRKGSVYCSRSSGNLCQKLLDARNRLNCSKSLASNLLDEMDLDENDHESDIEDSQSLYNFIRCKQDLIMNKYLNKYNQLNDLQSKMNEIKNCKNLLQETLVKEIEDENKITLCKLMKEYGKVNRDMKHLIEDEEKCGFTKYYTLNENSCLLSESSTLSSITTVCKVVSKCSLPKCKEDKVVKPIIKQSDQIFMSLPEQRSSYVPSQIPVNLPEYKPSYIPSQMHRSDVTMASRTGSLLTSQPPRVYKMVEPVLMPPAYSPSTVQHMQNLYKFRPVGVPSHIANVAQTPSKPFKQMHQQAGNPSQSFPLGMSAAKSQNIFNLYNNIPQNQFDHPNMSRKLSQSQLAHYSNHPHNKQSQALPGFNNPYRLPYNHSNPNPKFNRNFSYNTNESNLNSEIIQENIVAHQVSKTNPFSPEVIHAYYTTEQRAFNDGTVEERHVGKFIQLPNNNCPEDLNILKPDSYGPEASRIQSHPPTSNEEENLRPNYMSRNYLGTSTYSSLEHILIEELDNVRPSY